MLSNINSILVLVNAVFWFWVLRTQKTKVYSKTVIAFWEWDHVYTYKSLRVSLLEQTFFGVKVYRFEKKQRGQPHHCSEPNYGSPRFSITLKDEEDVLKYLNEDPYSSNRGFVEQRFVNSIATNVSSQYLAITLNGEADDYDKVLPPDSTAENKEVLLSKLGQYSTYIYLDVKQPEFRRIAFKAYAGKEYNWSHEHNPAVKDFSKNLLSLESFISDYSWGTKTVTLSDSFSKYRPELYKIALEKCTVKYDDVPLAVVEEFRAFVTRIQKSN